MLRPPRNAAAWARCRVRCPVLGWARPAAGRLLLAALRGLGRRAPACRRFGLRPQRKLRLPGRCCTAPKGAAEQLINIVFHGASPFAAKAAGILCAGRCTGLYPVVRRPAPVLGLYYTTFSKPIYRLLARPR